MREENPFTTGAMCQSFSSRLRRCLFPWYECSLISFKIGDGADKRVLDFLASHFSKRAIEDYVTDNIAKWIDEALDVEITWGGDATMKLHTNMFVSASSSLVENYLSQDGEKQWVLSLPIGILDIIPSELEKIYLKHLQSDLETHAYFSRDSNRCTSRVPLWILEAVGRFFLTMQPVSQQ